MAIVPISGLEGKDKQDVDAILSRSLYFMGMEPTRKSSEEGRYFLVTTKNSKKLNAQRETVNLLSKYYKKKESPMNSNNNQGRRETSTPTHFSSYASASASKHPTILIPLSI